MNPYEVMAVLQRFESRCALTDSSDIHFDHFIPEKVGGETSIANCYPLDGTLNERKGALNPFEFFEREDIRNQYDKQRFDDLVLWLSIQNNMSVEEFRKYTESFFE